MLKHALALSCLAFTSNTPAIADPADFKGLGNAFDGAPAELRDVSSDGSIVAGFYITSFGVPQPFVWEDSGVTAIYDFLNIPESISGDGSTMTGIHFGPSTDSPSAWDINGNSIALGTLPLGINEGESYDASHDGTYIVGKSRNSLNQIEAFRWTSADGMVGLGFLPGHFESTARAISADGSTVAGSSRSSTSGEAFVWTELNGMISLENLTGGPNGSVANGISSNGNVVIGTNYGPAGERAVRWVGSSITELGNLPVGQESEAKACNEDGSIIVGNSFGPFGEEAFIWTEADGMRSLKDVLMANIETDISNWHLLSVDSISADGTTIIGLGFNPQGQRETWVAKMDLASDPCPCDWNDSGSLNDDDFFAFLGDFFGPGEADFNASGTTNDDDFFGFLGCFFSPPEECN